MKQRALEIFLVIVVAGFIFSIVGLVRVMERNRLILEDEQQRLDKLDERMGRTEKNLEQIAKDLNTTRRDQSELRWRVEYRAEPPPLCGDGDPCDGGSQK